MARLKSRENSENIAEELKIGSTKVFIHTDYCCKTTEKDVKQILERIAKTALDDFALTAKYIY
ncbi:MAG: hypothetical protein LIO44_07555 [Eubacterium sp.]|nr:hypothetical protein [Eubacterium sp.]